MEELEIDAYGECEKMTYYNREDQFLRQRLQKEIPILRALIQNLYEELDRKLHLNGAKVPITFGYDTDTLGSYTRRSAHEKEHFHFSLLFIAYGVKNPLSKEDRIDLFKHEYAHYMQYNMQIPEKYKWQAGTHGSAWKYCCSLIGAAPTPYYKAGEALMNHDYDKVLKNRIHDKSVPVRDTYQQLKTAQKKKDEVVQYKLGDAVTHPKFGHGIVEKINQRSGGVHLHIRFDGEVKCIDQKWLSRNTVLQILGNLIYLFYRLLGSFGHFLSRICDRCCICHIVCSSYFSARNALRFPLLFPVVRCENRISGLQCVHTFVTAICFFKIPASSNTNSFAFHRFN